jgi:hypothetical protein
VMDSPEAPGSRASITFESCALFAGRRLPADIDTITGYWMQIYDVFPRKIRIEDCFFGGETLGVYVDTSVTDEHLLGLNAEATKIEMSGPETGYKCRFYRAAGGHASFPTDEVTHLLAHVYPFAADLGNDTDPTAKPNLVPAGIYRSDQIAGVPSTNIVQVTDDTSTFPGYALSTYQVTIGTSALHYGNHGGDFAWGATAPAGQYTFSLYARSTTPATLLLIARSASGIEQHRAFFLSRNAGGERYSLTFAHDPSVIARLGFVVDRLIPDGSQITVGLFMVNRGRRPSPYVFPGNALTEKFIGEYQGNAPPTGGTYRLGDRVLNTEPAPGGYVGWVCTEAGTPGTWKGFGLIQS